MTGNNLPRVLIIGQTFTTDTGGGITLSSLFRNWPKEKLAIAAESKEALDLNKCANYYRIGYNELKMPFPFSLAQRKTKSGMVTDKVTVGAAHIKKTNPAKEKLKNSFDNALNYAGLLFWVYGRQQLSKPFLSWVEDFGPDVIYYQPNSYKSIDFVLRLKEIIKVPLISHVMDDWFSFCIKPNPFFNYWSRQLDEKVKNLFNTTQLHLSICDYMSAEYLKRYGHKFYPFHNAVELSFWEKYAKADTGYSSPFSVLYAGRVGYGIDKTLLTVANVVEKMANNGKNIALEIQTKDQNHPMLDQLTNHKHVNITKPIGYNELPKKFAEADALLIPCDFEGSGVKFIKYSMPTKVSEYMATGTPTLVIGPADTALVQYARQGWAMVVDRNSAGAIEGSISALMQSKSLRSRFVKVAQKLVSQNHDENLNVKKFREQVRGLLVHR